MKKKKKQVGRYKNHIVRKYVKWNLLFITIYVYLVEIFIEFLFFCILVKFANIGLLALFALFKYSLQLCQKERNRQKRSRLYFHDMVE